MILPQYKNLRRFGHVGGLDLTKSEKDELVTNCDRFNSLKHSTVLPFAFTEYGALMLASVLNSPRAIEAGIYVVPTNKDEINDKLVEYSDEEIEKMGLDALLNNKPIYLSKNEWIGREVSETTERVKLLLYNIWLQQKELRNKKKYF